MDKRRLAGTDLDVSVVCYGPMRIATSRDDPDHHVHERAMRAAIERGVNLFHSSYEYGVRWLMHDVLKNHPERHDLHHLIKVPVPDWDDEGFDPAIFESRIDEALSELCTDRIALVQWMWRCRPHEESARLPLLSRIADDVEETFDRLRAKGKVAHLGCFPYFPESAVAAMARQAQSTLIAYYNPLELEMSPVIDALEENGRGFLAIRPLYEGILTDRHASQDRLPADHRLRAEKYTPAFEKRDAIAEEIPQAGEGMTAFAIRFPLMSAHCASVIVGLNSEDQVNEICGLTQNVTPDPDTVAHVRALATR